MNDLRKECPMRHENGNCTVTGGFCTAVNDPICEGLHNAYDSGYRAAALRARQELDRSESSLKVNPPDSGNSEGRVVRISKLFTLQELCHLEDALAKYDPDYLSQSNREKLKDLKSEIIAARRWRHQFGKSQH